MMTFVRNYAVYTVQLRRGGEYVTVVHPVHGDVIDWLNPVRKYGRCCNSYVQAKANHEKTVQAILDNPGQI